MKESRVIDRLVDAGFQLEIDDFGKGYSSLNTLKDINARTLKLDMAFLQMTDKDKKRGEVIIESVIQMGKRLGMHIVAEGVETVKERLSDSPGLRLSAGLSVFLAGTSTGIC